VGDELSINYATSAAGSLRIEIQDDQGKPIDGFSEKESIYIIGDEIDRVVRWKAGSNVRVLEGRAIKLRLSMIESDLFSIRFRGSFQTKDSPP
jgi:hypothetical protein